MIITDRSGKRHQIYSMLLKDARKTQLAMPLVSNILGFDTNEKIYNTEDELSALQGMLEACTDSLDSFDLEMAKAAIRNYMGADINMKELTIGTQIIDRDGKEFMAYSYKLSDYNKAMELLEQIDFTNFDINSYDILIEIIYLALNEQVDKELINASMDAEFARKALAVYYDFPS